MRKGFTLVETLVAIALFSIVVAIAAGGFTNALKAQREAAALISVQSNAGLAIEQMAREIRTGYLFCDTAGSAVPTPSAPCAPPNCQINGNIWTCTVLNFWNASQQNVEYSVDSANELGRAQGGAPQAITASNVKVDYLTFTIFGNNETDHWNPRITIAIGVSPNSGDPVLVNNVINLQTTVSARAIDCSATGC